MSEPRKPRIVFVDDDPAVLRGLQLMLHGARRRWDMEFVDRGAEALAVVRRTACDVVVSDLRMPGMDGAQLLAAVRAEFPATRRVVLSGYADPEVLARVQDVAHAMLAKPCDSKVLRETIERLLVTA